MPSFDPDKFLGETAPAATNPPAPAGEAAAAPAFDPDAFISQTPPPTPAAAPEQPSLLGQAVDTTLKGLDYLGGVTRTALAAPLLEGVTLEDVGDALKAKPLSGEEILMRAGAKPSFATTAAGLATEILTDPLTYTSFGASAAGKISKLGKVGRLAENVLKPASKVVENIGETIYKSAPVFRQLDKQVAKVVGREVPVSNIALKYKIFGNPKQVASKMEDTIAQLSRQRQALFTAADQTGIKLNINNAIAKTDELLETFIKHKDPLEQAAAKKFDVLLNNFRKLTGTPEKTILRTIPTELVDKFGKPITRTITEKIPATPIAEFSFQELSKLQHNLNSLFKGSAFQKYKDTEAFTRLQHILGAGLKETAEESLSKTAPELAAQLKNINQDWGTLHAAASHLPEIAGKVDFKFLSPFDIVAGGFGGAPIFTAKKVLDVARTTRAKTTAGLALKQVGAGAITGPALDIAARRGAIVAGRPTGE